MMLRWWGGREGDEGGVIEDIDAQSPHLEPQTNFSHYPISVSDKNAALQAHTGEELPLVKSTDPRRVRFGHAASEVAQGAVRCARIASILCLLK
jgi:hypothetical protein